MSDGLGHLWYAETLSGGERTSRCDRCGCCSHWPLGKRVCGQRSVEPAAATPQTAHPRRWPRHLHRERNRAFAEMADRGLKPTAIAQAHGVSRELVKSALKREYERRKRG